MSDVGIIACTNNLFPTFIQNHNSHCYLRQNRMPWMFFERAVPHPHPPIEALQNFLWSLWEPSRAPGAETQRSAGSSLRLCLPAHPLSFKFSILSTLSLQQSISCSSSFSTQALVLAEVSVPVSSCCLYPPNSPSRFKSISLSWDLNSLMDLRSIVHFQVHFFSPSSLLIRIEQQFVSSLHARPETRGLFHGILIFVEWTFFLKSNLMVIFASTLKISIFEKDNSFQ